MHCRTFSNSPRGSDSNRVWNAAECKCTLEVLPAGVSAKLATEQPRHLNRNKTRENHCNILKNFPLHGFIKNLPWFRCGGKGEHLNHASRLNQTANSLATSVLRGFQQLYSRFRFQPGLERSGMQMCLGGASGGGAQNVQQNSPGHLNRNKTRKIHCNLLRYFLLYGFSKHLLWFRCQQGLERSGMQMCPGGASGGGVHKTCSRTARGI